VLGGNTKWTALRKSRVYDQLKGKVTLLFIAHQLPRGLKVDEVLQFSAPAAAQPPTQMSVIEEEKAKSRERETWGRDG